MTSIRSKSELANLGLVDRMDVERIVFDFVLEELVQQVGMHSARLEHLQK